MKIQVNHKKTKIIDDIDVYIWISEVLPLMNNTYMTWDLYINFDNLDLIKIQNFSFTKMHLKIAPVKWWPPCPGRVALNPVELCMLATHARIIQKNPICIKCKLSYQCPSIQSNSVMISLKTQHNTKLHRAMTETENASHWVFNHLYNYCNTPYIIYIDSNNHVPVLQN